MPEGRDASASATVNGKIYIIGGGDGVAWVSRPYAPVRIYDPSTDSWSTGADMPTPRKGLSVGVIDGYIYAVGGYDPFNNVPGNILERYDPVADKWLSLATVPQELHFPAVAVVDGMLYAMGGFESQPPGTPVTANVWRYNPKNDSWQRRADMPAPRTGAAVEVLNHQLYVLGGRSSTYTDAMTANDIYTP